MPDLGTLRAALASLHADREHSAALPRALGMAPQPNPVNLAGGTTPIAGLLTGRISELYRVGEAELGSSRAGLYVAFADEWHDRSAMREPYRRKLARALVEHRQTDGRWLAILMDHRPGGSPMAEFILPRRREGSKSASTTRALVNLRDPSRFHLELLQDLDTVGHNTLGGLSRKWNESFSVERVTSQFHNDFRELRDRFVREFVKANPHHPVLSGRDPAKDVPLLAFGTRQLGRLLFLWFLQQKRWLGGPPGNGSDQYLVELFQRYAGADDGFFDDVLLPVFFDGLGLSEHDPRHRAVEARFGKLPFLGGGIFRPDEFEAQLLGVDEHDNRTVPVSLPNALFDPGRPSAEDRTNTVLGFLGGYRFTTQESTPDDQSVDPDPELLGKVFENLYQEDDRHDTGAYYTPREIVHFMCREALDGYLRDQVAIDQDTLDWLRAEAIDWEVSNRRLDPGTAEALHHALDTVTILDPAVGSGAFLVGAMQEIVLLRRGLEGSQTDADLDAASLEVAEWKRRAITQSLFGVDINPMAVEICKLRLWLSLVIDLQVEEDGKPVPLPDLEFRILAGDSLVDRMGAEPFLQSLPPPEFQMRSEIVQAVNRLQHEVDSLKQRFAGEGVQPHEKRDFARRIRRAEMEVARVQLQEALERAQRELDRLQKAPKATKKALKAAEDHLAGLERLEAGLGEDAPFQKPFLWPVNFHEEMAKGGFDIVLANPPYVRMEHIDNIDEESYGRSFPGVAASRADLLVYFYARALQLLKLGGQLAFITSNSFVKRVYGSGLLKLLGEELTIVRAIDFGELSVFDATVEPYVLIGERRPPPREHRIDGHFLFAETVRRAGTKSSVRRVREQLEALPALLAADHVRPTQASFVSHGWKLESDAVVSLFDRLMFEGTPLGDYVQGRIYYGVKTGLNEAFVIDQARRDQLVAADPRSAEVIKPWLRGEDIKRWEPEWTGWWLIFTSRGFPIDRYPAVREHLLRFRERLERRATAHLHPWYELQQPQEGCYTEYSLPKVVWPDISRSVRVAWDDAGLFIANTAYAMVAPRWLVAVLNSRVASFLLCQITNTIPGGFVRMIHGPASRLPIFSPDPEIEEELEKAASAGDEDRANAATARLFRLTPAEQEVLESWFATRALADAPEDDGSGIAAAREVEA